MFDQGRVYFTTKGDDRVWVHDIAAELTTVLYHAADTPDVLTGLDNIIVSAAHDLYVAEDAGNLEVVVITPELVVAPWCARPVSSTASTPVHHFHWCRR